MIPQSARLCSTVSSMSTLTSEQQELRNAQDLRYMLHQRYGYYKPGSLLEAVDRAISDYISDLRAAQESPGRMPLRRLGELHATGRLIELPVPLGTTVYHTTINRWRPSYYTEYVFVGVHRTRDPYMYMSLRNPETGKIVKVSMDDWGIKVFDDEATACQLVVLANAQMKKR